MATFVAAPNSITRLALYRLGGDHYNTLSEKIAYGNENGLISEESARAESGGNQINE